jgi:hypothetical protein
MKKSRFTEEQIVFALKQANWIRPCPKSAASWASLTPRFTPGEKNTAEFLLQN